jgi:hypothetical protein
MQADVAVAAEPLHPSKDRVVRGGAAANDIDERQRDGDDERLQDADEDDAQRRRGGDQQLCAARAAQCLSGVGVNEPDGGGHDHRAEVAMGR